MAHRIVVGGRVLNCNETVKRLNAHIFGLGAVEDPKRQPDKRSQIQDRKLEERQAGLGYRITIISFRRKRVDAHDNLRWGAKPLVDAITTSLGFVNDDDERLQWDYQQVVTTGAEGTAVKIDRIIL